MCSLEKEKINLNIQARYFNNYPLGTIVSQEPKGGVKITKGRTRQKTFNLEKPMVKAVANSHPIYN